VALTASFDRPEVVRRGAPQEAISELVLGPGESLAYLVERSGYRALVLDDQVESLPPSAPAGPPVVRANGLGVGMLMASARGVALNQFLPGGPQVSGDFEEAEGLVYSPDGLHAAFAARRGSSWFIVVDGKEGPAQERVVSPAFSPGGKHLAYRARRDGARFVVVADLAGSTVRQHPAYQLLFAVRFTADGKSVAYGVKDGAVLAWKVEPL
jgi:hypothetical protein